MPYRPVSLPEALDPLSSVLPLVLRHVGLEDVAHDVPESVVVVFKEDDDAGGLRVEGRGDLLDGEAEQLLDCLVVDGGFLVELVDGAAVHDGVLEAGGGVGHVGGGGEGTTGGAGLRDRGEEGGMEE